MEISNVTPYKPSASNQNTKQKAPPTLQSTGNHFLSGDLPSPGNDDQQGRKSDEDILENVTNNNINTSVSNTLNNKS